MTTQSHLDRLTAVCANCGERYRVVAELEDSVDADGNPICGTCGGSDAETWKARHERLLRARAALREHEASRDLDAPASHVATRWSSVGEFGDALLSEDPLVSGDARAVYSEWSDEKRARFWQSYAELDREPLGVDVRTPDYAALFQREPKAGRIEERVRILQVSETRSRVDSVELMVSDTVFADAVDAEWSARGSVIAETESAAGTIGADSATAELNRRIADEERKAVRARRLMETLIVHDRRKVVVVWPKLARVKDSAFESKLVEVPNSRFWFSSVADAEAHVETLLAKLAHRDAPARLYKPRKEVTA